MAEFIASTQTVTAGNTVAFAGTTRRCANVVHTDGSGIFRLKGGTCCNPAKYRVIFNATTTATAANPIQMTVYYDGEALPAANIDLVPAAVGDVLSGSTASEVQVVCGCAKLSVMAVTAVPLTSANILIERIA